MSILTPEQAALVESMDSALAFIRAALLAPYAILAASTGAGLGVGIFAAVILWHFIGSY